MAYVVFSATGYGVESPGASALAGPMPPLPLERRHRPTGPACYFFDFT